MNKLPYQLREDASRWEIGEAKGTLYERTKVIHLTSYDYYPENDPRRQEEIGRLNDALWRTDPDNPENRMFRYLMEKKTW